MSKHALVAMASATVAVIVIAVILSHSLREPDATDSDWKSNWAVAQGFDIAVDSDGFQFPTAIAFVPEPGDAPSDPIYFVSELRGRVRVVTNNREVLTFAEGFFELEPEKNAVRIIDDEVGMGSICLAPNQGYVFVTFSYHDTDNILRNNVARFTSQPGSFSVEPSSMISFTEVLANHPSGPSHQIGGCQVYNDLLYVSVADAHQTDKSQKLNSPLGKVLRMTLDGNPAPENPFYENNDTLNIRNYIWALGLRNPFGMKITGGDVFIADNGPDLDRLLRVEAGVNYLWDGTNTSIGTNADATFYPGNGVAQLDIYPAEAGLFPSHLDDNLFMTMTGNPEVLRDGYPAIWSVPYDASVKRVSAVSKPVVRYRGQKNQVVSGVGLGPDGLYFPLMVPDSRGVTRVLKLIYSPGYEHPYTIEQELNPVILIDTYGCRSCHSFTSTGDASIAPNLETGALVPRLDQRLNSQEYAQNLAEVDSLPGEPFASFRDPRQKIREAQDLEKIRLWIYHRILEPRFDHPGAAMPRSGLSKEQADSLSKYLAGIPNETMSQRQGKSFVRIIIDPITEPIERRLPYPTRENARTYLASVLGIGLFFGVIFGLVLHWRVAIYRRRRE